MNIDIAEESFQQAVYKKMEKENLSLISAVYSVYEEFRAEEIKRKNIQPACQRGCSVCCFQLTTCTQEEAIKIIAYLKAVYKDKALRQAKNRYKPIIKKWADYCQSNHLEGTTSCQAEDVLKVHVDLGGLRCVFLNKGICEIYPVRPINCRTLFSRKKCQSLKDGYAEVQALDSDCWASNLLNAQFETVSPLVHWLYVSKLVEL